MNSRRAWLVLGIGIFAYLVAVTQRSTFGVAGVAATERFDATAAALSTVALYASYGLPIVLGLWARKRGWPRVGPWTLGKWGPAVNVIAIVWVAFMVVLMSLPPNGLAGVTLSATCAVLFVAWFGGVRNIFKGPRR